MFEIIFETIISTLAEFVAGKAVEKGRQKHAAAVGWIGFFVLLALVIGLPVLGVFLIHEGVWPIAVLMFLIAAFILYIVVRTVMVRVRGKKDAGNG